MLANALIVVGNGAPRYKKRALTYALFLPTLLNPRLGLYSCKLFWIRRRSLCDFIAAFLINRFLRA